MKKFSNHSFWNERTLMKVSLVSFFIFLFFTLFGIYFGEQMLNIDQQVLSVVYSIRTEWNSVIFHWITSLADPLSQIAISVLVVLILFSVKRWRAGLWYGLTVLMGAYFLNNLTKDLINRQRPPIEYALSFPSTSSFPSGHSMGAMIIFFSLMFIIHRVYSRHQSLKLLVAVLCLSSIGLIGISRIYLGVHFLSDVIGGFALGLSYTTLSIALFGLDSV